MEVTEIPTKLCSNCGGEVDPLEDEHLCYCSDCGSRQTWGAMYDTRCYHCHQAAEDASEEEDTWECSSCGDALEEGTESYDGECYSCAHSTCDSCGEDYRDGTGANCSDCNTDFCPGCWDDHDCSEEEEEEEPAATSTLPTCPECGAADSVYLRAVYEYRHKVTGVTAAGTARVEIHEFVNSGGEPEMGSSLEGYELRCRECDWKNPSPDVLWS